MCWHLVLPLQLVYFLDALLELKKQRLLFSLQTVETQTGKNTGQSGGGGGEEEGGEKEEECGKDDSDDLQGIKCQAPIEEVYKYIG